jgi:hypothetical protein
MQDVTGLVAKAFPEVEILSISTPHSHFDLIGPDGTLILPETWHDLVQPGWSVSLQRRSQPQNLDEQPQPPSSADRAERRYAITDLPGPFPPAPKVFTYPSNAVPSLRKDPYDDSPYQFAYQNAQGGPDARRSTYEAWENMRRANMAVPGAPTPWTPPKPLSQDMLKSSQEGLDARNSTYEAWENLGAGDRRIRNPREPPSRDIPKLPKESLSYESAKDQKRVSMREAERLRDESVESIRQKLEKEAKRAARREKNKNPRDTERRYRLEKRFGPSVKDDSEDKYRLRLSEKRSSQPMAGTVGDDVRKECAGCDGHGMKTMMRQMGPMIQRSQVVCPDCYREDAEKGNGKVVEYAKWWVPIGESREKNGKLVGYPNGSNRRGEFEV